MRPATRSLHSQVGCHTCCHAEVTQSSCALTKLHTYRDLRILYSLQCSIHTAARTALHCTFHQSLALPSHPKVMWRSRGHNTTINKLHIRRGLRTSSKYSVASLQQIILCAYPSFNSFLLHAVALCLLQLLLIDVLCFYCTFLFYT